MCLIIAVCILPKMASMVKIRMETKAIDNLTLVKVEIILKLDDKLYHTLLSMLQIWMHLIKRKFVKMLQ